MVLISQKAMNGQVGRNIVSYQLISVWHECNLYVNYSSIIFTNHHMHYYFCSLLKAKCHSTIGASIQLVVNLIRMRKPYLLLGKHWLHLMKTIWFPVLGLEMVIKLNLICLHCQITILVAWSENHSITWWFMRRAELYVLTFTNSNLTCFLWQWLHTTNKCLAFTLIIPLVMALKKSWVATRKSSLIWNYLVQYNIL